MKIKISYTVAENCRASADLMAPDGTFIKNLWNFKQLYANRTYTETIDDRDNLPAGDYKLRLTTNNIRSYWENVIGNNSQKISGPNKFYNMEQANDMDSGTNHYYYTCRYNESKTSCFRIPKNNIRISEPVFDTRGMAACAVCVKNGVVYWAGVDAYKKMTWADEFANRFIDEGQPLKQSCEGFPDITEEKVRRCVHILIDANDLFAGYRLPDYTKQKFVDWFNQYVFRADWSFTLSGLWATRETDNSEVQFVFGREYTPYIGRTYPSMIGLYEGEQAEVTGLAVSDDFIYVAYGGQEDVWYWNSRDLIVVLSMDGKEVNRVTVPQPGRMIVVGDYLFYGSGTKVHRANLDRIGGIESTKEIEVSGFTVRDISYYEKTDTLSIITTDGIVRYYDKEFNLKKERGNKEMYWEKPQVYKDKFYWEDTRQTYQAFICTDHNNGLQLIGDGGNQRIQVFDNSFVYRATICWMSTNYSVNVINDDPTRIFCYFLEYNRDYTNPKALKWNLVNNWGCYAVNEWQYCDMPFVLNGKTYAKQQSFSYNKVRLIELNPEVGLVPLNEIATGSTAKSRVQIYPDGCVYYDDYKLNYYLKVRKQNLLRVKEDGFFEWDAPEVVVITGVPPVGSTWNNMSRRIFETIEDRYYVFNAHRTELGNHLTSVDIPTGEFIDNGFPSDHKEYYGDYMDDVFPVGNGVIYPGGQYVVCGEFIICNVHGEFWGAGQTNKWHLFDKNLVALHTYGIDVKTIRKQGIQHPAPKMAGNSFSGNLVKMGEYYYLYHCDEGHHGGVHAVRFEGMDTVKRFEFPALVYDVAPNPYYVYPLEYLPRNGELKDGDAGWHMYPVEGYSISSNDLFRVKAGSKFLSKTEPSDISVYFKGAKKAAFAWYDVDPVTATKWALSGYINFEDNSHTRTERAPTEIAKFQIIDDMANELFRVYTSFHYASKTLTLYFNEQVVFSLPMADAEKILDYYRALNVWCLNGIITARYHNYPTITLGRVETKPAHLRIAMISTGTGVANNFISLRTLKFSRK